MLKLNKLVFQNIGRFIELQEIDLTSLGDLVQLDGVNHNSSGSSGAGKSTVFKALDFLLGINDVSNTVLQSRLTKEPMTVTGFFDYNGAPLRIERGKKLLIDLNGEITTGSSKLSEEKLDQILAMPRELFRKILHKRQGEGGFFLDMGPSDVHKFLTNCLGLEVEQAKVLKLETRLKTLADNEISIKSAVESYRSAMDATKNAIISLGLPPVLEHNPELLVELENKLAIVTGAIEYIKHIHEKNLEGLEKERVELQPVSIPFDRSSIETIEKELSTLFQQYTVLEDLERIRCSDVRDEISELRIRASKLQEMEHTRQNNVKSEIAGLQITIRAIERTEQSRQTKVQSDLTLVHLSILKHRSDVVEGDRAKATATNLAQELQKVRASLCPTCEQNWVNEAAKAKEIEILNKLQELKKIVVTGITASKELITLEEESKRLTLDLAPKSIPEIDENNNRINQLWLESQPRDVPEAEEVKKQILIKQNDALPKSIPEAIELRLKKDFKEKELLVLRQQERDHQAKENKISQEFATEYASLLSMLHQRHQRTLQKTQDQEKFANLELQEAKNNVKSYEDVKKRYDDSFNSLNTQLSGHSGQFDSKNKELLVVQEEIELATIAKNVIKSYLSCSFEDALDGIGDEATKMIRGIPNMSNSTVQFEGLKENKDGKIKEEVNCVISMDGEIGIPVKSLSGGERSSVDLGIDLAVIKFIEERTGHGIDLFILDEPFTGLDSQCCEDAIEMLKNNTTGKRIFLVDHNPQVAQSIENRLTVVRDGLTSKIIQQ